MTDLAISPNEAVLERFEHCVEIKQEAIHKNRKKAHPPCGLFSNGYSN